MRQQSQAQMTKIATKVVKNLLKNNFRRDIKTREPKRTIERDEPEQSRAA